MRLLAVGDSFTYGEELADLSDAWPYLLSKQLDYEVTNMGQPGGGNTQMIRNVVENCRAYDLIIIAWSHYARIEFADEYGVYDTWPGSRSKQLFTSNTNHRNELTEYITRYHCDKYLYKQYLLNIVLIQQYLKLNNKKYIMLDSVRNHQGERQQSDTDISSAILTQIDTRYYLGWPNSPMVEWAWGTPKGPRGHFLEEGHQRVAKKINEHIRNLGWVS